MGILLALDQITTRPEELITTGLAGFVAQLTSTEREPARLPSALASYYRVSSHLTDQSSLEEANATLSRFQSQRYAAHLVLPYCPRALGLVAHARRYGWRWHIEGVTTLAQAVVALEAGAAGVWIEVATRDVHRELAGDELCSQVARYVDDHYASKLERPVVVASDLPDLEHADRMLEFGCNHLVLSQTMWQSVVAPFSNLS